MKFSGSPTRTSDSYQFLGWHRVGTSVWHQTTQQNNQYVQWFNLSWGNDSDNLHGIPRHLLSMLCKWNAFPRMRQDGHGECFWLFLAIILMQIRFTNARGFCFRTRDTHSTKHSKVLADDTSPTFYQKNSASFKSREVLASNVCHWWCCKLLCCKAAPGLIALIQEITQLSLADSHHHSLPLASQGFWPWPAFVLGARAREPLCRNLEVKTPVGGNQGSYFHTGVRLTKFIL